MSLALCKGGRVAGVDSSTAAGRPLWTPRGADSGARKSREAGAGAPRRGLLRFSPWRVGQSRRPCPPCDRGRHRFRTNRGARRACLLRRIAIRSSSARTSIEATFRYSSVGQVQRPSWHSRNASSSSSCRSGEFSELDRDRRRVLVYAVAGHWISLARRRSPFAGANQSSRRSRLRVRRAIVRGAAGAPLLPRADCPAFHASRRVGRRDRDCRNGRRLSEN